MKTGLLRKIMQKNFFRKIKVKCKQGHIVINW